MGRSILKYMAPCSLIIFPHYTGHITLPCIQLHVAVLIVARQWLKNTCPAFYYVTASIYDSLYSVGVHFITFIVL